MSRLFPSSREPPSEDAEPRVVGVDSEDAGELLAALSAGTAREILAVLHDESGAPSEVARAVDTTLQNAQYHIEKLEAAGLIRVVDTAYSEKGREMKVYAPADRPLVVFAGREEETTGLRAALSRLLGGVGVLGLASLVIDRLARGGFPATTGQGGDSADGGSDGAPTGDAGGYDGDAAGPAAEDSADAETEPAEETATEIARETTTVAEDATRTATETVMENATEVSAPTGTAADAAAALPPGLLFFAGGAAVLLVGFALWYLRR